MRPKYCVIFRYPCYCRPVGRPGPRQQQLWRKGRSRRHNRSIKEKGQKEKIREQGSISITQQQPHKK